MGDLEVRRCFQAPPSHEVMAFAHRRSTEVLVLMVFTLVYFFPKDLWASAQQLLCLMLLAMPQSANYSQLFTISASVALMAQLLGSSKLLGEAIRREHDLLQYLGLLPDLGIVCRQVIIIILVKIESTLEAPEEGPIEQEMVEIGGSQRAGSQLPDAWRRALRPQVDPVTEVRRLLMAVPQMASVAILAITSMEETLWCLPPMAAVTMFYTSGDMVKPQLRPGRLSEHARFWIQVLAGSLAIAMVGEISMSLWLPPATGLPSKPTASSIAHWEICRNYDPWNPELPRSVDGKPQMIGTHPTQRERCGADVMHWLCISVGLRVPKFALFFLLCCALRTDWETSTATPRWLRRTVAFMSRSIFDFVEPRTSSADEQEKNMKLFIIALSTLLSWLLLIVAFVWQRRFNIVALGYLWLLLLKSSSVTNATLYEDPVRAVLWPARAVGAFNFLVILFSAVCQYPAFPCPYPAKLEGLAGDDHVSRFLSGEQCLHASQRILRQEASDASQLGPLFQSVGMIKTGGLLQGTVEELVHCLVFASCLVQRILVERWHDDLREHFRKRKALLDFRARWYAEKLATSRQVQLSMWDTKRQVLLNKLSRVTQQLNTLRSIWDGQRPAFTEEEEEVMQNKARVEYMCLEGGVNEQLVIGLLKEFEGGRAIQGLPSQQRLQAHAVTDRCIIEYLHRRYLRKLKMITSVDEAAWKRSLVEECQHEVDAILNVGQESVEVDEEELPLPRSSTSSTLRQRRNEDDRVENRTERSQTASSFHEATASGRAVQSSCWTGFWGRFVDDMLFIREKDETLYEHRKGNSPQLLLLKSLLSQSVPALVVASALQFMAFRSVTSAVSVSIVVMSLMAFPHVPWTVWVLLQWFNLSVIFAKVVFQLPVFCEDGQLNFRPCRSLCGHKMPWTAVLGLVKTSPSHDPCSLARPSLWAILWPELLFAAVLLVVMCAARLGGRFGSTSQILASLKDVERKNRRMSTYINREMLKNAVVEVEEEEDEDSENAAEEPPEASRLEKWIEKSQKWLKEYVIAPAYVRKPAMDLYELRLCLALTCLAILLFGWSTMVDSGRSFTTSLQTNNFSSNQVRVLVMFMIMIVVDRALYTWYRGDHGSDGNQSGKSYTWKGLTARIVQKIMVLVHLVSIHSLFIEQWSNKVVRKDKMHSEVSLISMSTLSVFYVLYVMYLALSSLQLKFDVHVMRGGLRFTHSTDIGSMCVFKAYSVIPFLNELRVITDWTVTETSMNLFMWLKLEDAHHGLYRTRLDMEGRALTAPAEARPLFEKFYMGVALLVLLLALLVGPIIFFSALNTFMLRPSVVMSATMNVDLKVEADYGHRSLKLYSAVQDYIDTADEVEALDFQKNLLEHEIPISKQVIRFPLDSDHNWETSTLVCSRMAGLVDPMSHPDVTVKLRVSFIFRPNSTKPVEGYKEVVLNNETREILRQMLNGVLQDPINAKESRTSFAVADLFPRFERISHRHIVDIDFLPDQEEALTSRMSLTFTSLPPFWSMSNNETAPPFDNRLKVTVASNYVSSSDKGEEDVGRKKLSINSLYLGVVLTIGNLFRSIFKNSAQRMIYEEVCDTHLVLDLCDGIYLARVQGNLHAEWMLYHELIRIYRSPEILAHVTGRKGGGSSSEPAPSAANSRWGLVAQHVRRNSPVLDKSEKS